MNIKCMHILLKGKNKGKRCYKNIGTYYNNYCNNHGNKYNIEKRLNKRRKTSNFSYKRGETYEIKVKERFNKDYNVFIDNAGANSIPDIYTPKGNIEIKAGVSMTKEAGQKGLYWNKDILTIKKSEGHVFICDCMLNQLLKNDKSKCYLNKLKDVDLNNKESIENFKLINGKNCYINVDFNLVYY